MNILPISTPKQKKAFVNFPYRLYASDPHWVPHLKIERHEMIDPRKNPFFKYADVQLFIAEKDGEVVGRISAQVNRLHNERYNEKTGHFGFFESVNDPGVAAALFSTAEKWLRDRGMNKIVGPLSLSVNEEVGVLVEGFDSDPYPFMAHNFPYYDDLIKTNGFQKTKDLFSWAYDATKPVPEPAQQISDFVRQQPGLVIRPIDKKHIDRELRIISDVFNSAWAKNWGFIPWTDDELKKMAKDMKMILEPEVALIAEVDGVPAAISIAIPNYYEAIKDLKGRLFPFGIFKLIYRLKTRKVKTGRLALLGIKKEFRSSVMGGLSVLLYTEMHRRGRALGYIGGELSWTLEDNEKINNGISLMGGRVYKKYRVYEKELQ